LESEDQYVLASKNAKTAFDRQATMYNAGCAACYRGDMAAAKLLLLNFLQLQPPKPLIDHLLSDDDWKPAKEDPQAWFAEALSNYKR